MMEQILKKATAEMSIEDNVEYWHTHETGNSLIEFLGISEEQYNQWISGQLTDDEIFKLNDN